MTKREAHMLALRLCAEMIEGVLGRGFCAEDNEDDNEKVLIAIEEVRQRLLARAQKFEEAR